MPHHPVLPQRHSRTACTSALIGWLLVLLFAVGAAHAQTTTTVEYIHTDALGSPVAVTNEAGQVIERTQWEPYGAAIGKPAYDGPGYTGHVIDGATGLTYMQQRYYDPAIGRFLSVDPVTANSGTGANFNRYWYANDNPYRFTDPDGRWVEDAVIGIQSIALGVESLVDNVKAGNSIGAAIDAVGIAVDAAAVGIPGVPGGAGLGIKAARAADNITDATQNGRLAQDIASGKITDGVEMATDDALSAASNYLGDGYKEVSSGIFRSADGTTQVRRQDGDIIGAHGPGPHMNFEALNTVTKPNGGESFRRDDNIHVKLPEESKP